MTNHSAQKVQDMIEQIRDGAEDVLRRSERFPTAADMSDTEFKALAKEVEEVGEQVNRLETTNRHVIPALFEVPHGNWNGWDRLVNYRNRLAHQFHRLTPQQLLADVNEKLDLRQVVDLLGAVKRVAMSTEVFDFGSASDIRKLPRTAAHCDLLPGASVVTILLDQTGELLAARSWRDERDRRRASIRYIWTYWEDEETIHLSIRDTQYLLQPKEIDAQSNESNLEYNLLTVPKQPYGWIPQKLEHTDHYLTRKKRGRGR